MHTDTVLNYEPAEQRYLALNPVLPLGKNSIFGMVQAAADAGEGLSPAIREFGNWLRKHSDAVLRLFVTAPEGARFESEGISTQRLRLVGTQAGFRQRIRLYVSPEEALELSDSPDYVLYAVDVPLRTLHPDTVTLEDLRRQSREFSTRNGQVGNTLPDSFVFAGCACVFADIPPHMISIYRADETL